MSLIIEVQNLKCEGCAGTITSKILELEGIEKVIVYVESSTVEVSIEKEAFSETVVTRLSELGYPRVGDHNGIGQKAKSYVSCAIGKMS